MLFKHVDMESALRRLADRRIDEAMQQGKFSNLPGAGRPLELEPMPAEEKARLTWWALRLLRQNQVVPEEIRWRKQLDGLRERIEALTEERPLAGLVAQVNLLVRRLNTLGTNALNSPVVALDLDTERQRLRQRLGL